MKIGKTFALALPLLAFTAFDVRDAAACGGCFVPPDANTQVTGHRMVLSVSPAATTLWDQIEYSGEPESFAWVLPTKGIVEIGVSSDLLFNTLDYLTNVSIVPPYLDCPYSCDDSSNYAATGAGPSGAGGGSGGGVEVIASEVVGPYETVQLSANDPAALQTWLADHGYDLPPDVAPIVDAYVNEGFNFLALKLVPGQGIDSMKPVRVTTPGATPSLPLRMVAAGTGVTTPITLYVVGEGRYKPANFGQFTIDPNDVVWNWDTQDSNYAALKQQGFDATGGLSWLIESAEPTSPFSIEGIIQPVLDQQPELSGYGEADGTNAAEEAAADLDALYGAIAMRSMWLTRMHGELPRVALENDLQVAASMDQTQVSHVFIVEKTEGTVPECPPDPCGNAVGSGANGTSGSYASGVGGANGATGTGNGGDSGLVASGGGCALGGQGGLPTLMGLGLLLGLAVSRRRRR